MVINSLTELAVLPGHPLIIYFFDKHNHHIILSKEKLSSIKIATTQKQFQALHAHMDVLWKGNWGNKFSFSGTSTRAGNT